MKNCKANLSNERVERVPPLDIWVLTVCGLMSFGLERHLSNNREYSLGLFNSWCILVGSVGKGNPNLCLCVFGLSVSTPHGNSSFTRFESVLGIKVGRKSIVSGVCRCGGLRIVCN